MFVLDAASPIVCCVYMVSILASAAIVVAHSIHCSAIRAVDTVTVHAFTMHFGVSIPCTRTKTADANLVLYSTIIMINTVSIYTLVVHLMIVLYALTRMVMALFVCLAVIVVYTIPHDTLLITHFLVAISTFAIAVTAHLILPGAV